MANPDTNSKLDTKEPEVKHIKKIETQKPSTDADSTKADVRAASGFGTACIPVGGN